MGEEFKLLLEQLPNLLQYYVPGYIFIMIYDFMLSKKRREGANLHLECLVVSYIVVVITRTIFEMTNVPQTYRVIVIIEFLLAALIAYLVALFLASEHSDKTLRFFRISRSARASIWDDYIDTNLGAVAAVFLDDENIIYYGKVVAYDYESEDSNYIAMAYYDIYDLDWQKQYDEKDNTYVTLIKLDNVFRIEFNYDVNSRIAKKNLIK